MATNLLPGQYQIGDVIFGRNTVYPVTSVEVQGYNIQAQDSQMIRSDELQFGFDSFQPAPIIFEMGVLDFQTIPNMDGFTGNVAFDGSAMDQALNKLAQAWRGDNVRNSYGNMMQLKYCERDGSVRVWYGRPRKFQASKRSMKSNYMTVHAEFQRVDTLCYDDPETAVALLRSDTPVYINRVEGQAPSWLRIVGYGPLTHPVITIGDQQVELDITVADGEAFEVNSYPWSRRAIKSDGTNISAKLIGTTQYLDRLVLPANSITPVRWTSNDVRTWVPDLSNESWSESIQELNLYTLPSSFTSLGGKAVVRFDALNFGSTAFPWVTPSRYLAAGMFANTSAILYNKKTFASNNQYCEATLVEPAAGRSAIVIMSNDAMTNYVMLEVTGGILPGTRYLNIRNGTAWNSFGTVRASWQNPSLIGWSETDKVAIGYNPSAQKYSAYFNGTEVCSWVDSGGVVSTGSSNRKQGFIFDMDGNLLTQGVGFKNILAYDRATVPAPVGEMVLLWRNAYPAAA